MTSDNFIIAIESAILGGSCTLANGATAIDETRGKGGVSRAEDLLSDIDSMLKRQRLTPTEVTNIVVSAGPGSFTGIRIGIATALGFAAGLGITPTQISLFEAMLIASGLESPAITAVPAGRGMVQFAVLALSVDAIKYTIEPKAISAAELIASPDLKSFEYFVVFDGHFDDEILADFQGSLITIGETPATTLVAAANDHRVRKNVEPILISKG